MKAEVIRSCTAYDLVIDGKSAQEYTSEELLSIYQKMILSKAGDKEELISLIEWFVEDNGNYTFTENCEQCGDVDVEYSLEIIN